MAKKDKPPAAEKPKVVLPTQVRITRRFVQIKYDQGNGSFSMKEDDNPLPAFPAALTAMAPLVSLICHLPKDYHDENLRVLGFDIGSKGGARTVIIHAAKSLDDSAKQFEFSTPERLLEKPTEEGEYSTPLTEAKAALVWEAIEEACQYVKGFRAQGKLELVEETEDPAAEDPLKFETAGAQ